MQGFVRRASNVVGLKETVEGLRCGAEPRNATCITWADHVDSSSSKGL